MYNLDLDPNRSLFPQQSSYMSKSGALLLGVPRYEYQAHEHYHPCD